MTALSTLGTLLGTLAAVVVGFSLHELSARWRLRREDRRVVARALAELLEVRFNLLVVPAVMSEIRKHLPISMPAQADLFFRAIFAGWVPGLEGLQQRYNDAVSAVAGTFPLLAYQLRSKDVLTPYLTRLRSALLQVAPLAEWWVKLEDQMTREVLAGLDDLLLKLAKEHGRKTLREVRSTLEKKAELPKELDELITGLFAQAQKMDEAGEGRPSPEMVEKFLEVMAPQIPGMGQGRPVQGSPQQSPQEPERPNGSGGKEVLHG